MVCFAWAGFGPTTGVVAQFEGDRAAIRQASVVRALEGLLERLA
jgi:nicotinamide mononucleotide (NMN) deamidase PncC